MQQQKEHGFRCHHQSREPGPVPPFPAVSRCRRCSRHWRGARPPAQADGPCPPCLHRILSRLQGGTRQGGERPDHPCCLVNASPVPPSTRRDNERGGPSPAKHPLKSHPRSNHDCCGALAWDCWASVVLDATV